MATEHEFVQRSVLDEERFGIPSARAAHVTSENLAAVLDFCADEGVTFLIARCPATDLQAAQAMEAHGFRLMDTLVYYTHNVQQTPIPAELRSVPMRSVRPGEETAVQLVATEAFRNYAGHYHADPRLPQTACDAVYQSWAYRACISKAVADQVLVAEVHGEIVGFAALRQPHPEEGEGVLYGVRPKARGQGVYWSLLLHSLEWCRDQGCLRMIIPTQITNLIVQKVWVRCGFEPSGAYYTFHKWFDT